jgi:hypothetical protein
MDSRSARQRIRAQPVWRKKLDSDDGEFAGSGSSCRRGKFAIEECKQKEREKYMRKNKFPQGQNLKPARASRLAAVVENEIDFAPSPGEAASYVSRGSPQGHEVQHWLAAEAQLLAERKLTQVHGFQNRINFPSNPILLVKQ